jgi:hypothetical protein
MAEDPPPSPWSLPKSVVRRKHEPSPREGQDGWKAFKPCLRWEFEFTCIYCRLRETDFGRAGQSSFGVEHYRPKDSEERPEFRAFAKDYCNCYYACVHCNSSKGSKYPSPKEEALGSRFFDPCRDVWAQHFALAEDTIVVIGNSKVAQYTLDEVRTINAKEAKEVRRQVLKRIRGLNALRARAARLTPFAGSVDRADMESSLKEIDDWLHDLYACTVLAPGPCAASCGLVGRKRGRK